MQTKWLSTEIKGLCKTLSGFKNEKDLTAFMRDIATIQELESMAKRWQAAQMLQEGKPYREISKFTGLSVTTVTRVAYWMKYGEGGYALALKQN